MTVTAQDRPLVLVTGGAGFIGSHVVDGLLAQGFAVRVLDALLPQVHPDGPPSYLDPRAELMVGDLRDERIVRVALRGVDVVVHFAAAVGVGQSMYDIVHYCSANVMATASLLETIEREKPRPRRMIVASSMSLYGEGLYDCGACGPSAPRPRPASQLAGGDWPVRCPQCASSLRPVPTPETKPLFPTSVYAVNKRDHEELMLVMGRALGIPTVALRFFNVYGDRQALSNPYTGVAAIFASALLNGTRPLVFEDGLQSRDFIHVSDIVAGCLLAINALEVADEIFNLGTGRATDLLTLASLLKEAIPSARHIEPEVLGRYREGDIRSCYADISRARARLGFDPRTPIEAGVRGLAAWACTQSARNRSSEALALLRQHGLVR